MQIIEISVHYGLTQSLPNYCNVKPGFTLRATVEEGEDPETVKEALLVQAKADTEEACDQAMEAEGQPAKFWTGPRFDALRLSDEKYIAVVPAQAELPEAWKKVPCEETGWRIEPLLKQLRRDWASYTIDDISHGYLEALPELAELQLLLTRRDNEGVRYCVALPADTETGNLAELWKYAHRRHVALFQVNVAAYVLKYASENEATLIDCLDGDLSKLPDLTPKEEFKPLDDEGVIVEDDDFEDDDDDYEEDED